jgi:hypothetical protein
MNAYGAVIDTPEAAPWIDLTPLREWLRPTLGACYPEHEGGSLDHQHAFVVRYDMDGDRALAFHADDAEVTVNIGLSEPGVGGDLWFEGPRCALHRDDAPHPHDQGTWSHAPGVALLHAGADRHGARPIARGSRQNLVLWLRSSRARSPGGSRPDGIEEECPTWCATARSGALP